MDLSSSVIASSEMERLKCCVKVLNCLVGFEMKTGTQLEICLFLFFAKSFVTTDNMNFVQNV